MARTAIISLWLAAWLPGLALAANPIPGVGQLLQQTPSTQPVAPKGTLPPMRITPRPPGPTISSPAFWVRQIVITGNTVLPVAHLDAWVAAEEGRMRTLGQLDALAARLTRYYQQQGYPLTRVYVPAQTVTHGIVHLVVLEARYGTVTLQNSSRVDSGLLQMTLAPLRPGALIATHPLDQRLMLLSVVPGVVVSPATLSPGTVVGTSNLQVAAAEGPIATGGVTLDNYGNPYTGRTRLSAGVTFNNPFHLGDQLTLQGLASAHLDFGQLGYSALVDGVGTRVGATYSALRYRLGGSFAALDAHGSAQTAGLTVSQPFYLSPTSVFYGAVQMNHQQLNDTVGNVGIVDRRHINSVASTLYGNHRDALFGGGLTSYSVSYVAGRLTFDNAVAAGADAATADTQGTFSKIAATIGRLQQLPLGTTLAVTANGQQAFHNLDMAQQFVLGGPNTLPGYPQGEVTGDSGYDLTEALRHALPIPLPGRWQTQVFADQGEVTFNRTLWTGFTGPNQATLADAGVGLHWRFHRHWASSVQVAWRTHASAAALAASSPVTVWWDLGWQA
ncbi:MAG: ShlB/FhaC/HecB family hemolysin secretion/activation protein [Acidiferrobacteraceae bacterium]